MALRYMLLGILKDEPQSGYDLNKLFKHVVHYFWSADQSRIYRTLHTLHAAGLVAIEVVEQSDNPDKKLYHITSEGRAALEHWLASAPDTPTRMVWLGQLFFGDAVPNAVTIQALEARRTALEAELKELERRADEPDAILDYVTAPETPRRARFRALTLDYGIHTARAKLAWLDRALAALRALPDDAPPRE